MSTEPLPGRWDPVALRAGAGVALMISVPITLVAAFVDSDNSGVNALFFFGAMLGFVLGSGCAAWVQRTGTPMTHAVATASGAYLAAQAVFVVIRLVRGETVNWFAVFFTLMLVVGAGILGGLMGVRVQRRGFVPSVNRSRQ